MGSEEAPVHSANRARGWQSDRPNFSWTSCFSSAHLFRIAVDRMDSNHCRCRHVHGRFSGIYSTTRSAQWNLRSRHVRQHCRQPAIWWKGERALSAFSCDSVRRRQYMEAMHLTISSDILLGHWYR